MRIHHFFPHPLVKVLLFLCASFLLPPSSLTPPSFLPPSPSSSVSSSRHPPHAPHRPHPPASTFHSHPRLSILLQTVARRSKEIKTNMLYAENAPPASGRYRRLHAAVKKSIQICSTLRTPSCLVTLQTVARRSKEINTNTL